MKDEIANSLILISVDTAFFISSTTIIAEIVSFDLYYMFAFLAVFFRSSKALSKLPFCKAKHLERERILIIFYKAKQTSKYVRGFHE